MSYFMQIGEALSCRAKKTLEYAETTASRVKAYFDSLG